MQLKHTKIQGLSNMKGQKGKILPFWSMKLNKLASKSNLDMTYRDEGHDIGDRVNLVESKR